jgi:hypothetical protein
MSIEALIFSPLIILMNIMTVAFSIKNRLQLSNADSETIRARQKAELRLVVVGIIISLSYVSSVVLLALWQFSNSNLLPFDSYQMSQVYYDSFDTFTLCNPYLLLILSEATRTEFFRFLGYKQGVTEVTNLTANRSTTNARQIRVRRV